MLYQAYAVLVDGGWFFFLQNLWHLNAFIQYVFSEICALTFTTTYKKTERFSLISGSGAEIAHHNT